MRKRIKQLARGKFEYAKPELSFSEERIEFSIVEGNTYGGTFTIKSTNQKKIRGIVYSTNSRMECLTPQFEGEEVRIRYEFHSKGLSEGLTETGDFVIVCDGPLTTELYLVIDEFKQKYSYINVIYKEKNEGLASALTTGLNYCRNDIVARMDSDDIALGVVGNAQHLENTLKFIDYLFEEFFIKFLFNAIN